MNGQFKQLIAQDDDEETVAGDGNNLPLPPMLEQRSDSGSASSKRRRSTPRMRPMPLESIQEDEEETKKRMVYIITKHIDENKDLYFIKLVAGALKRPFMSLIVVEGKTGGKSKSYDETITVNVKYTYAGELLYAWATIIEKVKKMLKPDFKRRWDKSETLHDIIIEKEGLVLAFARYVAFIIMTESNNLVPRNKTRYVINKDLTMENNLTLNLMRALKDDLKALRNDLQDTYL